MNKSNSSTQKGSSIQRSRHIIKALKADADAERTRSERLADWITSRLGSMTFLMINFVWFALWIIINTGVIPGVKPFDPFPFSFLTMVVSLEAIFLAIIVLISQNRAGQVADLREEVDLQVDIITEVEITKVLVILKRLAEKNGIDLDNDPELKEMLEPTNMGRIESALHDQVMHK